jgi:hypothetical protein
VLREMNAFREGAPENPFGELPNTLAFRSGIASAASPLSTTIPDVSAGAGRKLPWKIAMSVLLAFLIGAAGRLAMGPPRGTANHPAVSTVEMSENERVLQMMVRDWATANPIDPEKLKTALRANLELAFLLIDQRRMSEAETLADQLASKENNSSYQVLGKLLQGINYSFADDASKSNATFQLAMIDKNYDKTLGLLTMPPAPVTMDFRLLLVRALDRNDKAGRLPPDLNLLKAKSLAVLQGRPLLPAPKKGG